MSVVAPPVKSLRVVVAEDEPNMREYYRLALPTLGHEVVGVAQNGQELIELCRAEAPDLVIADIAMPGMDGIEAADRLYQEKPVAIVLVSAHYDKDLIHRAQLHNIMAYLVKPITEADLETSISIAVQRFNQFQVVHEEARTLKQALNDRKLIERAKGIIMHAAQISESEAFRRLQKMSWDKNKKMVEIAETIVTAAMAMNPAGNAAQ